MASRKVLPDSDSGSDSDRLTSSRPSDEQLAKALRDVVADTFKSGNSDELTVKRMRLAAEKALGIEEGFFRGDSEWKTKSDQIIKDEVTTLDRVSQEPEESKEKQEAKVKEEPSASAPKPAKQKTQPKRSTATPRKRQKTATPQPEDDEDGASDYKEEEEEEEVKKPAKKRKATPQKAQPTHTTSKDIVGEDSDSEEKQDFQPAKDDEEKQDASESEISVVLDEEPQPSRKRQQSSEAPKQKKTAPTKKKPTPKAKDADQNPDQSEIKRLQGWLIKCGIRKFWSKELAPYDTLKAKIKHLKEMLADAGMKGRYSLEKAKQIREERELKADLEMVQEGAKQWGTGSPEAEEASDSGPRRRRLTRGRQSLAFLEDEDGEETD